MSGAPDGEFTAWVNSLPDTHWAKYDLSACRLGWDAARKGLSLPGVGVTREALSKWFNSLPCDGIGKEHFDALLEITLQPLPRSGERGEVEPFGFVWLRGLGDVGFTEDPHYADELRDEGWTITPVYAHPPLPSPAPATAVTEAELERAAAAYWGETWNACTAEVKERAKEGVRRVLAALSPAVRGGGIQPLLWEAGAHWLKISFKDNGDMNAAEALFRAALSTPPLAGEGDWVMVPREPTPGMIAAGSEAIATEHGADLDPSIEADTEITYRAMLASAPSAPNTGEREKAIEAVEQALGDYAIALRNRQHGGVAADRFVKAALAAFGRDIMGQPLATPDTTRQEP